MPTLITSTKCFQDEDGQWWYRLKNGGRTRTEPKVCPQCGKTFVGYLQKHCSRTCAGASLRSPSKPKPQCVQCRSEFQPTGGGQRFCSHTCAATWMHAHRPQTTAPDDTVLVNADNPRYSQDQSGQWWYTPQSPTGKAHSRTRAKVGQCQRCGQQFLKTVYSKDVMFCSRSCAVKTAVAEGRKVESGAKSHRWQGGRRKLPSGYVVIYCPGHPSIKVGTRKYVAEHRLVMEKELGRYLEAHEQVHHKNGVRDDNRIENLELWRHQQPAGQRAHEQQHCPTCTCFTKGES